jgi:hypothetical protein
MSVQTRSQLQASALTITNETTAGANTAARVGGLFDDLADTATLDRERGYASLFVSGNTNFTPTSNTSVALAVAMGTGIVSTYNFTNTSSTVTYTGTTSAALKVSANITFSASNNREFEWYIAKNGNTIASSKASLTMSHNNGHAVYVETYLTGAANDVFALYVKSIDSSVAITIQSLNFTAVTL